MKKLALVIVLTVLATRLFSQDHRPPAPEAPRPATVKFRRLARPAIPAPPLPPPYEGMPRLAPADGQEIVVIPDPGTGQPGQAIPEPSSDEPIRIVPWKGTNPGEPRLRRLPGKGDGLPAWFPRTEAEEAERAKGDDSGVRVLLGRLSATEDRAKADLRRVVEAEVLDWLADDVAGSWRVPTSALDGMVLDTHVQAVTRSFKPAPGEAMPVPSPEGLRSLDELYTLYRAGQRLDFSPTRRIALVELYRNDIAAWRMRWLGVGVAVVLAVLAILAGYIRTDEATKGYYTNRLRAAALVALGAAGAAAYYVLA